MALAGVLLLLFGWLTILALRALLWAVVLLCWLAARLSLLTLMALAALLRSRRR